MKFVHFFGKCFCHRRLYYFAFLIIIVIGFFYFFSYPKNGSYPKNDYAAPVILLWTTFSGRADFYLGLGNQSFLNYKCPANDCIITTNRSELQQSDAVVFHARDFNISDLPDPRLRKTDQYFVFFFVEPPSHNFKINFKRMNGFFNWTMTFRWDSDVVAVYGKVRLAVRNVSVSRQTVKDRKLAAWIVSNCHSGGGREAYAKSLNKYIAIDKFGKCGNGTCDSECEKSVFKTYKFYLSFENSLCKDYVTEKLFKVLRHDIVPIVYGSANYSALAPPHSYIDVRDFKSPEMLARYLRELDANDTAYNEYLKWKDHYQVDVSAMKHNFCELCKKLHQNREEKRYEDIDRWWHNGDENSNHPICAPPPIVNS